MATVAYTLTGNMLQALPSGAGATEITVRAGEVLHVVGRKQSFKGHPLKSTMNSGTGVITDTPGWSYDKYYVEVHLTTGEMFEIDLGNKTAGNQVTWTNDAAGMANCIDAIQAWLATFAS